MAVRNRLFDSILVKKPKLNSFDLSYENRLTCKFGQLVPCFVKEVLPGDVWRNKTELMVRMAPMVAPIMSRIDVFVHFFFVPNRLVYQDWEKFITAGIDGQDTSVAPYVSIQKGTGYVGPGTLYDFMGCPVDVLATGTQAHNYSALPFRAYNLIYNSFYRDELLQNEASFPLTGGVDSTGYVLLSRCWEKDYFTSARPTTQLGAAISLPIQGTAPLLFQPNNPGVLGSTSVVIDSSGQIDKITVTPTPTPSDTGELVIDNSQINAGTINELRRAIKLQEWQEKNLRSGNRYIENILAHFGVRSSDARLQRPEYLGGGKTPVVVSEVLQTSASTSAVQSGQTMTPQGNMAGHGFSVGSSNQFKYKAEEHGFIIGILSILPRTSYQQGTARYLSHRTSRFDYAWPEFAHLGEQEVWEDEIFDALGTNSHRTTVFGYQSRYAEYKFSSSEVHGEFKSSLAFWHSGRIFDSAPLLNSSFVSFGNDSVLKSQERIFAVPSASSHFYVQMYHDCQALRPLPKFGTPSF